MNIQYGGEYYWSTREEHYDNNVTMNDFLNCELGEDSGYEVIEVDGTYAEIESVDDGKRFAVHASGNGDSYNHKVRFELLTTEIFK